MGAHEWRSLINQEEKDPPALIHWTLGGINWRTWLHIRPPTTSYAVVLSPLEHCVYDSTLLFSVGGLTTPLTNTHKIETFFDLSCLISHGYVVRK
jgi:hypothetical protein